jgi:hypothetical protein
MGIKLLNRFFMDNCSARSIRKLSLKYLTNKVLVIDTSIYLYKFAEKGAVIENIYLMISVLRQHKITPVFIFDGKPPAEKKELLLKRKKDKQEAEDKYNQIVKQVYATSGDARDEMEKEMDVLKKQFVRVTDANIQGAKELMRAYGVTYIESRGESDQLCAYLVKHNYAWACLSDDMDMFLYGCPRVLRHMSMFHQEVTFYDTAKILDDLDMTPEVFKDIAILSGTDYNINEPRSLTDMVELYTNYLQHVHFQGDSMSFREWIIQSTVYIPDETKLDELHDLFDLDVFAQTHREEIKNVIDCIPFRLNPFDMRELTDVLHDDGFIFL